MRTLQKQKSSFSCIIDYIYLSSGEIIAQPDISTRGLSSLSPRTILAPLRILYVITWAVYFYKYSFIHTAVSAASVDTLKAKLAVRGRGLVFF